jgi:hypothetical protein
MHEFLHKNGWATFWANFSETHLVTLLRMYVQKRDENHRGCQIFLGTTCQNGKVYQITTLYTK